MKTQIQFQLEINVMFYFRKHQQTLELVYLCVSKTIESNRTFYDMIRLNEKERREMSNKFNYNE